MTSGPDHKRLLNELCKLRETGEALIERVEDVAASIRYLTNNLLDDQYQPELAAETRRVALRANELLSLSPRKLEHEAIPPFAQRLGELSQNGFAVAEQAQYGKHYSEDSRVERVAKQLVEALAPLQALGAELAEVDQFGSEAATEWWSEHFEEVRSRYAAFEQLTRSAGEAGAEVAAILAAASGGLPLALERVNWPAELAEEVGVAPEDAITNATEKKEEEDHKTVAPGRVQRQLFGGERSASVGAGAYASVGEPDALGEGSRSPVASESRESGGLGGMDSLDSHHRPYLFADFCSFCNTRAPTMTAALWQAEYRRLRASQTAFVADLLKHNNVASLKTLALRHGGHDGRRRTKPELAAALFDACLRGFVLGGSFTYQPLSETFTEALDRIVESLTDADFARHDAERRQKAVEHRKAITNPENLAEFHTFVRELGEHHLTDVQFLERDRLYADLSRQTRRDRQPKQITQFEAAELEGLELSILESFHEKRRAPVWIVQLSTRVERTAYEELNKKAKQLGGWFSSFKKSQAGFHFLTHDSALKFAGLQTSDADRSAELEERRILKLDNVSERFAMLVCRLFQCEECELRESAKEDENVLRRDRLKHSASLSSLANRVL